jgi:hypothetical protein
VNAELLPMVRAVKEDATSLRPGPDEAEVHPRTAVHADEPVRTLEAALGPAGWLGTRVEIQEELDGMAAAVRAFHRKQPDQVMKEVAAYAARLTELCVLLTRVEGLDRQYLRVRTQQVERWLAELDRQYRIASRLIEVQRQDLALLTGQV